MNPWQPYAIGAQYEGGLFTPSTVKSEMETVNNGVNQLLRDAVRAPERTRSLIVLFATEWRNFYESHSGFLSRSLNTTYGTVQEFRKRLEQWQAKLKSMGVQQSAPLLPKSQTGERAWLVPVLSVVAGAAFVWWLTRD